MVYYLNSNNKTIYDQMYWWKKSYIVKHIFIQILNSCDEIEHKT